MENASKLSTLSTQPPKCDVKNCSNDLKMQSDGKEERFYLHQNCLHSICNGLGSFHSKIFKVDPDFGEHRQMKFDRGYACEQ